MGWYFIFSRRLRQPAPYRRGLITTVGRRKEITMRNRDKEQEFLDKAAIAAFGALASQGKKGGPAELAAEAWGAADMLLKARQARKMAKYEAIIKKHPRFEALKKILKLDGYTGQFLDFMARLYAGKDNPLKAYAGANIGPRRTAGQTAIAKYFEDHPWAEEYLF